MKAIVAALLVVATASFAAPCNIVVPYQIGGPATVWANLAKNINKDIGLVQYKPGAFAFSSIALMRESPSYIMLSSPMMYSSQNPMKNPPVEMIDVVLTYGQIALSNKNVTFNDLLTKPLSVVVVNLGGPQHLLALQLQRHNPQLVIVPVTGFQQGMQLLIGREADVLLTPTSSGIRYVDDRKLTVVFEIPVGDVEFKRGDVRLKNYGMLAAFVYAGASTEQKNILKECLRKVTASPQWNAGLRVIHSSAWNASFEEKKDFVFDFIDELRRNGF